MAIDCKHPFIHAGAGRTDRLLKALMPSNVAIDNREMADLMVFAARFGKVINYWNEENAPDGDWSCFWENDYLFFLATVAAANTEGSSKKFRAYELAFLNEQENPSTANPLVDKRRDAVFALIETTRELALDLATWGQKADGFPDLQKDIAAIVRNTLRQPLRDLIAYAKGLSDTTDIGSNYTTDFAAFITSQNRHPFAKEWDITQFEFDQNINFIDPRADYLAAWQDLKRIFRRFVLAHARVQKQAVMYLKLTQNDPNRRQHTPHVTLFMSFLHLFKHLQDQLNALPEKHLDYYYNDILHLQNRGEIPDHAHLVFQLALNVYQQTLPVGTLFRAGKTPDGKDMFYALERPLTLNKAQVVEIKTLLVQNTEGFLWENTVLDTDKTNTIPDKMKAVLPFRPLGNARTDKRVEVGFAISSAALSTTKSKRTLLFDFTTNVAVETKVIDTLKVDVGTKDAWNIVKRGTIDSITKDVAPVFFALDATNGAATGTNRTGFNIVLESLKNEAAFVAPSNMLKNRSLYNLNQPAVRFLISEKTNENLDNTNAYEKVYAALSTAIISKVRMGVVVQELTDFDIYEGATNRPLGHTQNVDLTSAFRAGGLIVRCDEAFKKGVNAFGVFFSMKEAAAKSNFMVLTEAALFINGQRRIVAESNKFRMNVNDKERTISMTNIQDILTLEEREQAQLDAYILVGLRYSKPEAQVFDVPIFSDVNITYAIVRDLDATEFFHLTSHGGYAAIDPKGSALFPPFPNPEPVFFEVGMEKDAENGENTEGSSEATFEVAQPRGGDLQVPNVVNPNALFRGNLFIGVKEPPTLGIVSLLFQVADGTEVDLESFPPDIVWSYLSDNDWKRFPSANVVFDSTKADETSKRSLVQSGVIEFQMPADAKKGDTLLNPAYYWLRASATETRSAATANPPTIATTVGALPSLLGIYAQAGSVRLLNSPMDARHFAQALPPQTINQLKFRQAAVKQIEQPYAGFGGRAAEQGTAYHLRISERLRHKKRAITAWDYEHLVLEQFPEVRFVKCINHALPEVKQLANGQKLVTLNARRAGAVSVVVLPLKTTNPLRPQVNRSTLENIQSYLKKCSNGFTSGDDLLKVMTPQYQAVVVALRVKFHAGDTEKLVHNLDNDLARLIAPWAFDAQIEPTFNEMLHKTTLLGQIEALDYVDYVEDFYITDTLIGTNITTSTGLDSKGKVIPRVVVVNDKLKTFIAPNDARTLLTAHQLDGQTAFEINHSITPIA